MRLLLARLLPVLPVAEAGEELVERQRARANRRFRPRDGLPTKLLDEFDEPRVTGFPGFADVVERENGRHVKAPAGDCRRDRGGRPLPGLECGRLTAPPPAG